MGKSGNWHRTWQPETDPALRAGAGARTSWVHQRASLCRGISKPSAGNVQLKRNSNEELHGETESAGLGSTCPRWARVVGIGGGEQGLLNNQIILIAFGAFDAQ